MSLARHDGGIRNHFRIVYMARKIPKSSQMDVSCAFRIQVHQYMITESSQTSREIGMDEPTRIL
jgi:hypothetical protein